MTGKLAVDLAGLTVLADAASQSYPGDWGPVLAYDRRTDEYVLAYWIESGYTSGLHRFRFQDPRRYEPLPLVAEKKGM